MAHIRVCSYNVLSSSLCEPSFFTRSSPANLDPPTRLKRIKEKLMGETDKNAIICLQEVSESWSHVLRSFFEERDYCFLNSQYGNRFNGYMGVALAWPRSLFEMENELVQVVSQGRTWPSPRKPWFSYLTWPFVWIWNALRLLFFGPLPPAPAPTTPDPSIVPPFDPHEEAKGRKNTLVAARLRFRDASIPTPFVIGTYHMPCLFGSALKRQTMTIHAALVAQCIQKYANNGAIPHILAGDFNFKPMDACYQLITKGSIPTSHEDYPTPKSFDRTGWSCNRLPGGPLTSAYVDATGSESEVTNHSFNDMAGQFTGCLDYIFMSKHWTCRSVVPTPLEEDLTEFWPSATEPSDHILIAAEIDLKSK